MGYGIGIDLGGTNLRGGLWEDSKGLYGRLQRPSGAGREPNLIIEDLVDFVHDMEGKAGSQADAIGVGVPGIIDHERGVVAQSPHFPKWQNVPFRALLSEKLGRPIMIDNDANCAVLGEVTAGVTKGRSSLVVLTLGTGIGGGIYDHGAIWRGERGFAGELGHLVVNPEGPPCACGGRGCLELYASGSGLSRMVMDGKPSGAKELFLKKLECERAAVTPLILMQAAADGDEYARELYQKFGYYLGIGLVSIVNVLGIHTIIIGGGIRGAWDWFHEETMRQFKDRIYPETARVTEIIPSELGDDAGIIGAACAALRNR